MLIDIELSFFPAPVISVQITTNGAPVLGQSGYSLTCGVTGAEHLNASITYQWTKNNGTLPQIQSDKAYPIEFLLYLLLGCLMLDGIHVRLLLAHPTFITLL